MTARLDANPQTFFTPVAAEDGKLITSDDQIGHGQYSPNAQTLETTYEVIERKLETAGVLASGSGAPVFANQTALFYFDTATDKLYIRETSAYQEINNGAEETEVIGHSGSDPGTARESDPWIFVNTGANKVWIKERTGSPGSYAYAWSGPIFEGTARTLVVYNTQDTPGPLNISWVWRTDTLSPSGGGWSTNLGNAKWYKIITAPRNSNNAIESPAFRVGDPVASQISITATDGTNNVPSTVTDVQELVNWLNTEPNLLTTGGGGTGTDDQTASEVNTDTTNFNQNLSNADTTVQRALDTLDNLSTPLNQSQNFGRISGTDLAATNAVADQTFTVIPSLLNARTNFDEDLFLEATVHVRMQPSTQLTGDKASVIFEIVTPSDASTGIQSEAVELEEAAGAVNQQIRISGILPPTFTAGKLRTKNDGRTGAPPAIGVEGIKLEIRPDTKADEVQVEQGDLGNNLTGNSTDLEEIISEIDELPIQAADYEDVEWPSSSNGIDDNGTEVRREVTFARNLQNANNRAGISYTARITYTAQERGSRTDGLTGVNFVHKVYSNYTDGVTVTEIQSSNESTTTAGQQKIVDVTVPNNTTGFWVGITNNSGQGDAKLLITNYHVNFIEGIDASGFNGNLNMDDNTAQRVAQKFDDYTPPAEIITASGFDGNLATTDDTLQEIAQKFDDYNPTAGATTVNVNQFSDPNNFIGGLREVTGVSGVPDAPANVQQALVKTDYLLQAVYDPFRDTQLLDRSVGGGFSSTFSVNNATPIYSNPVEIPEELRDLGTDINVRVRVRISALGTGFTGDIRLVDPDNRTSVFYGDAEVVNTTIYDRNDLPLYVTFQRTIAAASVPDTFEVRFRRTDGGTTTTTFDQGMANIVDSSGGGAMGGVGGQTATYTTNIIWLAGASIYDRLTVASETTNYTLMSGHTFSAYKQLIFVYDGGAGSTQPLMQVWSDANLFQSFGAAGLLDIKGNWWLMVSRQSDTTFRFRWRGANNGLRRIIGIQIT